MQSINAQLGEIWKRPTVKEGIRYKQQLITNHCRDDAILHDVLEAVADEFTLTPV